MNYHFSLRPLKIPNQRSLYIFSVNSVSLWLNLFTLMYSSFYTLHYDHKPDQNTLIVIVQ